MIPRSRSLVPNVSYCPAVSCYASCIVSLLSTTTLLSCALAIYTDNLLRRHCISAPSTALSYPLPTLYPTPPFVTTICLPTTVIASDTYIVLARNGDVNGRSKASALITLSYRRRLRVVFSHLSEPPRLSLDLLLLRAFLRPYQAVAMSAGM